MQVTLTGTGFVAGATVATSNPGIAVGGVTVVSATQIAAGFTIAGNAALGAANVNVTTSGGTITGGPFTVNPSAPSVSITIRPSYWQGDLNDDGIVDLPECCSTSPESANHVQHSMLGPNYW